MTRSGQDDNVDNMEIAISHYDGDGGVIKLSLPKKQGYKISLCCVCVQE